MRDFSGIELFLLTSNTVGGLFVASLLFRWLKTGRAHVRYVAGFKQGEIVGERDKTPKTFWGLIALHASAIVFAVVWISIILLYGWRG